MVSFMRSLKIKSEALGGTGPAVKTSSDGYAPGLSTSFSEAFPIMRLDAPRSLARPM